MMRRIEDLSQHREPVTFQASQDVGQFRPDGASLAVYLVALGTSRSLKDLFTNCK